jgi:hypothetical protein
MRTIKQLLERPKWWGGGYKPFHNIRTVCGSLPAVQTHSSTNFSGDCMILPDMQGHVRMTLTPGAFWNNKCGLLFKLLSFGITGYTPNWLTAGQRGQGNSQFPFLTSSISRQLASVTVSTRELQRSVHPVYLCTAIPGFNGFSISVVEYTQWVTVFN